MEGGLPSEAILRVVKAGDVERWLLVVVTLGEVVVKEGLLLDGGAEEEELQHELARRAGAGTGQDADVTGRYGVVKNAGFVDATRVTLRRDGARMGRAESSMWTTTDEVGYI